MNTSQQDWLVSYLLTHGFMVMNTEELQTRISGMTALQIIEAMERAKNIKDQLQLSPLGKELL